MEIPDFETIFNAERYDDFLRVEHEKEKKEKERKKLINLEEQEDNCISY